MWKLLCIVLCSLSLQSHCASSAGLQAKDSDAVGKSLIHFNLNKVERPTVSSNSTHNIGQLWLAKFSLINTIASAIRHKVNKIQDSLLNLINLANSGIQTVNATTIEVNITIPKYQLSSSTTTTTTPRPTTTTTTTTQRPTTTTTTTTTTTRRPTTTTTTTTRRPTTTTTTTTRRPTTTTPKPNNTEPVYCDRLNDMVIIMDSSNSVTKQDYQTEKDFASKVAFTWKRKAGNNVAVIVFANIANILMDFMDTKLLSAKMVEHNILQSPRLAGGTYTHFAIRNATRILNSEINTSSKNVLLLTDGMSRDAKLTAEAAREMNMSGINAVVVGIGTNVTELYKIAGHPENVFFAKDFANSKELIRPVTVRLCENSKRITTW